MSPRTVVVVVKKISRASISVSDDDLAKLIRGVVQIEELCDPAALPCTDVHVELDWEYPSLKDSSPLIVDAGMEFELHTRQQHPDWEYAVTETARKGGDTKMPDGEGWEPNNIMRTPDGTFRNWERGEFTEWEFWRRRRPRSIEVVDDRDMPADEPHPNFFMPGEEPSKP